MRLLHLLACLLLACLLLVGMLAGCSQQTINSANSDADKDVKAVSKSVDQAAKAVKPDIKALGVGARVTTAIEANANLPHDTIRVDAQPSGVRLKGTVKTAKQKTLAGQVAKDTLGPGKTVENDLQVTGG